MVPGPAIYKYWFLSFFMSVWFNPENNWSSYNILWTIIKWSERNKFKQLQSKQKQINLNSGWRRIFKISRSGNKSMVKLPMLHYSSLNKVVSLNYILLLNLGTLVSIGTLKLFSSILFQIISPISPPLLNARTIYFIPTSMTIEMYVYHCFVKDGRLINNWSRLYMGCCRFWRVWIQKISRNLCTLGLLR